jgi:hypothetical protein
MSNTVRKQFYHHLLSNGYIERVNRGFYRITEKEKTLGYFCLTYFIEHAKQLWIINPNSHALQSVYFRFFEIIKNQTPRFLQFFASHHPYGPAFRYRNKVKNLDQERLASLIKACGFFSADKSVSVVARCLDLILGIM